MELSLIHICWLSAVCLFSPKTLFHLIGTIANVPIACHVPNFCSLTEVIELVGIIDVYKRQRLKILSKVSFWLTRTFVLPSLFSIPTLMSLMTATPGQMCIRDRTYTVAGGTDLIYSYKNAKSANNYGVELDIRKNRCV